MKSRRKKQRKKEDCNREDLISKLPDEILIRVLSLLSTQESLRCSVLSRRWAPLPKLVPMRFKFVHKYSVCYSPKFMHKLMVKFIRRVNRAVKSYRGETLDEFNIRFALHNQNAPQINKWVRFAMANKVKRFKLDFSGINLEKIYYFPSLMSRSCTSLKSLCLKYVNVTGKHLEYFLEYCPFLESLYVTYSDSLTSLKVDDPVRLKLFNIKYCYNLEILEISAPNLTSFKYLADVTTTMPLKSAPQLTDMLVGQGFYNFLVDNTHLFTGYLSQIQTLTLIVYCYPNQELKWPMEIPTLNNLKELKINVTSDERCICLTSWIEASPFLKRFVVQRYRNGSKKLEAIKPRTCLHHHLKEFEFFGFQGDHGGDYGDTKLILYVIENAVNLEKTVINCNSFFDGNLLEEEEEYGEDCGILFSEAKDEARKFQSLLSPTVEFVILP